VEPPTPAKPAKPAKLAKPAEPDRRAVRRELTAARTAEAKAGADLERAAAAERDSAGELAELDAALAELQRRRAGVDEELGRRKLARKSAERALAAARRRLGQAEAALDQTSGMAVRVGRERSSST
jgi:chromosome segregation ATPase